LENKILIASKIKGEQAPNPNSSTSIYARDESVHCITVGQEIGGRMSLNTHQYQK
jgi:hypothetical protein